MKHLQNLSSWRRRHEVKMKTSVGGVLSINDRRFQITQRARTAAAYIESGARSQYCCHSCLLPRCLHILSFLTDHRPPNINHVLHPVSNTPINRGRFHQLHHPHPSLPSHHSTTTGALGFIHDTAILPRRDTHATSTHDEDDSTLLHIHTLILILIIGS